MSGSPFAEKLAELQQIEAIIQRDHKEFLNHQTLCHISYVNESLPIYALSVGNQDKDILSFTFVGGIHGLEQIGIQVVLAFLETLLERLHWDLSFTYMLHAFVLASYR